MPLTGDKEKTGRGNKRKRDRCTEALIWSLCMHLKSVSRPMDEQRQTAAVSCDGLVKLKLM